MENNINILNIDNHIQKFFEEDDFYRNYFYYQKLPSKLIEVHLKLKEDCLLSGLPFFFASFSYLIKSFNIDFTPDQNISWNNYFGMILNKFERQKNISQINFKLPFCVALSAERIALNLLQRSTSISTFTNKFVSLAKDKKIKILDTRKTTPGLRFLEKYAVVSGGGYNHRFGQNDMFMIKDNHKSFFGGVEAAINFFKSMNCLYTPILLEIHSLKELEIAYKYDINFVMLDNFSIDQIREAIKIKNNYFEKYHKKINFEVSGNVNLNTLQSYLLSGVDAISIGSLTSDVPRVDLSLKI